MNIVLTGSVLPAFGGPYSRRIPTPEWIAGDMLPTGTPAEVGLARGGALYSGVRRAE
jgi:hypothetical protein